MRLVESAITAPAFEIRCCCCAGAAGAAGALLVKVVFGSSLWSVDSGKYQMHVCSFVYFVCRSVHVSMPSFQAKDAEDAEVGGNVYYTTTAVALKTEIGSSQTGVITQEQTY